MKRLQLCQRFKRNAIQRIFSQIEVGQFEGATLHRNDGEDAITLHIQLLETFKSLESVHFQGKDVVISQRDHFKRTLHATEVKALDHIDLVVAQI